MSLLLVPDWRTDLRMRLALNHSCRATCRLKSVLQSGTSNNDINVLKATNSIPGGVKVNHYFTSPHAWFLRTNVPNGMTMFWRERPEFAQDNDFDTKNAKAASYMRFSVGATDPLGIFGSNGP